MGINDQAKSELLVSYAIIITPFPEELREAITNLKKLNPVQFTSIKLIIGDLAKQSKNK